MAHGRRFRIEKQLGAFLRQYGRRGRSPHDPNDRGYDRKIEAQLKRLKPEELDLLLRDEKAASLHKPPLRIEFEEPANGWIRTHVTTTSADVEIFVSHTPNDFIRELITALLNAAEMTGSHEAVAHEEPRHTVFAFGRIAEQLSFCIYDPVTRETLVTFTGTISEVVLPLLALSSAPTGDIPAS